MNLQRRETTYFSLILAYHTPKSSESKLPSYRPEPLSVTNLYKTSKQEFFFINY